MLAVLGPIIEAARLPYVCHMVLGYRLPPLCIMGGLHLEGLRVSPLLRADLLFISGACVQVSSSPIYTGPITLSYTGATQASLAFTIVPQLVVKVTACSFPGLQ